MQAFVGDEFKVDLHVRIGLGEGLGHGAHVGFAIGRLRHEERVERGFGIGVAGKGQAEQGCAEQRGFNGFQHSCLQ
ncbi:hypothetical protein D3C86_2142530 [compost metagenome]